MTTWWGWVLLTGLIWVSLSVAAFVLWVVLVEVARWHSRRRAARFDRHIEQALRVIR